MPTIYMAARYSRNAEMRAYRDELEKLGYVVHSRWIDQHGGSLEESLGYDDFALDPHCGAPFAETDLTDLVASDIFIHFTSADGGGKGGRHTEFGYALRAGKRIIIVGPRENVFHCLPGIEHHEDWAHFIEHVRRINAPSIEAWRATAASTDS